MQTQYNDPKGQAGSLKAPLGLVPPHAMEQTAWVHKLGADKYGPWNWRETGVCASTYVNAILRHLNAWRDGEDLDPESGISHLAHVACSCNILLDAQYCDKLQDDRNKVKSYDSLHKLFAELDKFATEPTPTDDSSFEKLFDLSESAKLDRKKFEQIQEEYRTLEKDEILRDGDEVYVGFGDWLPLYIPDWIEQKVNDGAYRRKVNTEQITETEYVYFLVEGDVLQDGDEILIEDDNIVYRQWVPVHHLFLGTTIGKDDTSIYRRKVEPITDCDPKETCDSKLEPQDEAENEYRVLEKGDTVEEGDEHRFINSWYPAPKDVIGAPVSGMVEWRRKITKCDESIDSFKLTNCDLKESPKEYWYGKRSSDECRCGRRYVYHWLYGWICEDCELYSDKKDYYP